MSNISSRFEPRDALPASRGLSRAHLLPPSVNAKNGSGIWIPAKYRRFASVSEVPRKSNSLFFRFIEIIVARGFCLYKLKI